MENHPTKITFHTKIRKLERKTQLVRSETKDLGWYVLLEGSWNSLYIGEECPDWHVGDEMRVTIEKKFRI
jgi:hypothetical protein